MKIILRISTILILFLLLTGCVNNKEEKIITCKTTIKSEIDKEKINIELHELSNSVRTVTVKYKNRDNIDTLKETLKRNYCNSEIKKNYTCTIDVIEDRIVLREESTANVILGIKEELQLEDYKKVLEKKGFECK